MAAAPNRPTRGARSEVVVVRELEPLRASPRGRLVVRILQGDRSRRLDIREYVDEESWRGFTRRGINLSSEEFNALLAQLDELLPLLEGGTR